LRVVLGINNCFAVKRWPRPDEWAQIVSEELGLEVVQHSLDLADLDLDLEAEAQAVHDACGLNGVGIHSVFTGLVAYSANLMLAPEPAERERGETYWAAAIRFAAKLGAKGVGGHVGSLSRHDADNPARRDAVWAELRQRLARLSELARKHELDALLVENMACDREPSRMSDMRSLMSSANDSRAAITLCLDVGHQCVPGTDGDEADPYAWLATLGRHASVIHLQQTDAEADHHWPFTSQYNQRGRIRAPLVLEALAASGTEQATLILEVIPAFEADDARVLDELRQSASYWKQAVGEFEPA
jgi:D-erythrulose 1-phosphate 3-epimerase